MTSKRKVEDNGETSTAQFEHLELIIDFGSFLNEPVKQRSTPRRKYKKRDPSTKIEYDKHLQSYWKTKPMKVITSVWDGKIVVAAEGDIAILPTDHAVPNYLQPELIAQREAWSKEGLRDWKLDPASDLSPEAQLWLKTYTVKQESPTGHVTFKQRWNLSSLKALIGIHLKTVSVPVNLDNGKHDQVVLSLHHIHHFLTKMLPSVQGLETIYKNYQEAWRAYTTDWFDIFGCRGEKILIELVDNQKCFEEWKVVAKEAKNALTLELSKQILWNSKRNIGFRVIDEEVHIYLLTSISQLNIWNWLLQCKMVQYCIDHLGAIHSDFRDKLQAKKKANIVNTKESTSNDDDQ